MEDKTLVILSGSPRGGPDTWNTLFKYVINPLNADLALCTTKDFVSNNILFKESKYQWIMENFNNFEEYYEQNYKGNWKNYFNKGKGTGLYESGIIHFALKDFVYKNYLHEINKYDFIIHTRFDQFYTENHPKFTKNKLQIQLGENYGGICDRHAAFDSKFAKKFFSIVEYINMENSINELPQYPNCESVYLKHLEWTGLVSKVKRIRRFSFTSALKGENTNWRVPKYKILLRKDLMIKYPDEFIDSYKNLLQQRGVFYFLRYCYPNNITFIYLQLRYFLRIRARRDMHLKDIKK